MVAQVLPDGEMLEDLYGPLPYWGPAADDAKTAVHHAQAILRRTRTMQPTDAPLDDLNGPVAYWGPGVRGT